jgi:hypothetical protein
MGGVDGHADSGDPEVVAHPGEDPPALLGGDRLRRHGAADEGGVDGAVAQVTQIHAVVAGRPDLWTRLERDR